MKNLMHSGRRAFLMGTGGIALALPLLELTHGKAWSQNSVTKRFICVFSHGGTITDQSHSSLHDGSGKYTGLNHWKPSDPGEALQFGAIHSDLEAFKSKCMVLQGVDNMAGGVQAQYGSGGHDISNVTALTAADASDPWGEPDAQGPSIDHVIADRLAATQPVKFKRIHLNVKGHQYGTPFYAAAGQRVSGESSPLAAFNTIFAGVTPDSEPDPEFLRQQALRRSVVDGVLDGYNSFRNKVSQADRHRIDAHIEHLYALEAELNAAPVMCTPPTGITEDANAPSNVVGDLHVKIILAALRCGLTNVANLEIADIIAHWTPNGGLIDSAFDIGHSLGHYQRELGPTGESSSLASDWELETLENRQWRFSLVKQLLEGMDDPTFLEGGGTMLDNSLLYYTSEFSEPAGHVSAGQLCFLAGSAGGYLNTGRHLNFNSHAQSDPNTKQYATTHSTHNLYTSFLHAMGESDSHFGSDHAQYQGPLPGMTA